MKIMFSRLFLKGQNETQKSLVVKHNMFYNLLVFYCFTIWINRRKTGFFETFGIHTFHNSFINKFSLRK